MEPLENKPITPNPEVTTTPLPKVKTFRGDLADAVKKDNVSLVKIALAENKKRENNARIDTETSPFSSKNILLIGGSLLLVLIGIGLFAFFFFGNKKTPDTGSVVVKPDIVFVESTKYVNIADYDEQKIFGIIQNQMTFQISLGTIERMFFANGDTTSAQLLDTQDFFARLHTRIPSSLLRSLDPNFFFGIHSFNQNNPAIIFKVLDYQNAYPGMLAWEKAMFTDIGGLLLSPSRINESSSTLPIFQDKVIENKDTRALIDSNGKLLFFYSFVDQGTIVFATNPDTFREVISRLTKPKLIH